MKKLENNNELGPTLPDCVFLEILNPQYFEQKQVLV
ncbi:hypothetical protein T09_10251 [Trichinella sp. T9]|nr:hypothetical protein T09_10251 [Trichinella sp. T9]